MATEHARKVVGLTLTAGNAGSGRSFSPLFPCLLALPFFLTPFQFIVRDGEKFADGCVESSGFGIAHGFPLAARFFSFHALNFTADLPSLFSIHSLLKIFTGDAHCAQPRLALIVVLFFFGKD